MEYQTKRSPYKGIYTVFYRAIYVKHRVLKDDINFKGTI